MTCCICCAKATRDTVHAWWMRTEYAPIYDVDSPTRVVREDYYCPTCGVARFGDALK